MRALILASIILWPSCLGCESRDSQVAEKTFIPADLVNPYFPITSLPLSPAELIIGSWIEVERRAYAPAADGTLRIVASDDDLIQVEEFTADGQWITHNPPGQFPMTYRVEGSQFMAENAILKVGWELYVNETVMMWFDRYRVQEADGEWGKWATSQKVFRRAPNEVLPPKAPLVDPIRLPHSQRDAENLPSPTRTPDSRGKC